MTTDDVNKNSYSDFTVFWVNNWTLKHALYKCEYFPEKHTAQNIQKFIDKNLNELGLSLVDTPCTTDKGSNIIAATTAKTHVDCSCHRLNTAIDTAWKKILALDSELRQLDNFCHDLVKYVNQASGIQSHLPTSLKHGGETRPWRSLTDMFTSIGKSRDALVSLLRERKREHLISRIDVDLLNDVIVFLRVFPSLFDILEFANIPTLQNSLPVYYTLYEEWQPQTSDGDSTALMKREFLTALTNKYWDSLSMLHFVATFLDPSLRDFVFVRNVNDRQVFLKQVNDSIHTLAKQSTVPSRDDTPETTDTVQPSTSSAVAGVTSPAVLEVEPVIKKLKVDPFQWFRKVSTDSSSVVVMQELRSIEDRVNDELRDYKNQLVPCATLKDFNPLQWWGLQSDKFPLLSDIARRIFVIPASSSECERHFSAFNARNIISAQRNGLYPETVEALSVVLEGFKNNLIK
jgi:hypothetical protein